MARALSKADFDRLAKDLLCEPRESGEFDVRVGPRSGVVIARVRTDVPPEIQRERVQRRQRAEQLRPAAERGHWIFPNVVRYAYRGRDLFQIALEVVAMPLKDRAAVLVPLVAAVARELETMHANNVVHGDVKGENWLLSPQSDAGALGATALVPSVTPCDMTSACTVDEHGRSDEAPMTFTWIVATRSVDRRRVDVQCLGLTALHLLFHLQDSQLKEAGRSGQTPALAVVRPMLADDVAIDAECARFLDAACRMIDGQMTAGDAARELGGTAAVSKVDVK